MWESDMLDDQGILVANRSIFFWQKRVGYDRAPSDYNAYNYIATCLKSGKKDTRVVYCRNRTDLLKLVAYWNTVSLDWSYRERMPWDK